MEKQKIIDLWLKHGGTVQKVPGVDAPAFVYIDLEGLERFLADIMKPEPVADENGIVWHPIGSPTKRYISVSFDDPETDDAGILIRPSIKIE